MVGAYDDIVAESQAFVALQHEVFVDQRYPAILIRLGFA
jgi:hypothetical protein